MWFREKLSIPTTSPTYFREMVLEEMSNVEHEYQDGQIDAFSYYQRMRALERMLR